LPRHLEIAAAFLLLLAPSYTIPTAAAADFTVVRARITSPSILQSGEYVTVNAYASGSPELGIISKFLVSWTPVFEVK